MIELGDKVKDLVSGLEGVATARLEYLNGCVQYSVTPKIKKGATEIPSWNIDAEQLRKIPGKVKTKKKPTGGATVRAASRY